MDEVEALYQWLATEPSQEADRILAAALEHAEPPYSDRMVATLLQRRSALAWTGLIANYDRLDAPTRQTLGSEPEWVRAGVSASIRGGTHRMRQNGLTALLDYPNLSLSYLAADALRDTGPPTRALAGRVLRRDADRVCTERESEEERADTPPRPVVAERAALVAALREALRTYKFHEQAEVIEACLWFARDLGPTLWGVVSARRSPVARVVAQNLAAWDGPRLAGFLMLALSRPDWRAAARALLSRWSTRAHLLALLRNSDLLGDARVRQQLMLMRRPTWLGAVDRGLADLPAGMRARMPQWISCLGFTDDERVRWLKRWVTAPWPDLHFAAVRALASIGTPQAVAILGAVAARPGPMQYFAQCVVAGRRLRRSSKSRVFPEQLTALGPDQHHTPWLR